MIYSITEAITESKKIMQGYKWKFFCQTSASLDGGELSLHPGNWFIMVDTLYHHFTGLILYRRIAGTAM